MTSGMLADLYDTLGVRRSLSRPRVSNDNPHAEAAFKTLKYRPDWPKKFETLDEVTAHCEQFFGWYNNEHHSALGYVPPVEFEAAWAATQPANEPAVAYPAG